MTDDIQNHTVPKQAIRLSLITDSYMDCIANLKKDKEANDWNMLLSGLTDLILDKDYVLNDFRPREETNSVLRLYAKNRYLPRSIYVLFENFFKPLSLFRHITVPYTEEAIWQAFLLSQTYHLVGMRWHGDYEKRTFIVSDKDIAGWLGISREAFCQRKRNGSFNVWQLQRILEKSRASNDDILSLFGRKQDPDMIQRQVMNELHEIKMIVMKGVV